MMVNVGAFTGKTIIDPLRNVIMNKLIFTLTISPGR